MSLPASTVDWTGSLLELDVGSVAHGGHCVARYEGRVVFVRHSLPGERVLAEVTEDHGGSFCRANAVQILVPAAGRVTPPCPLARPNGCGGCDWQHASAATQRQLKGSVLAEQLWRLAGIDRQVEVEALPGGLLGWRTRARLAVDDRGRAGFRVHRQHTVVELDECPITVSGLLDEALAREWTPGSEVAVTEDAEGSVFASEIQDPGDGRPRTARVLGAGKAVERAADREWRVQPHGFWQVHPAAAETLAGVVTDWVPPDAGATAWDLYAGAGLFASVLADRVGPTGSVLAVESSKPTAEDLRRNLRDLPQVRTRTGRVEGVLAGESSEPRVVVLDPPRKGAGKRVVDAVAGRAPRTVIYVACDPAALARDIARFGSHGYRLGELRAFDAFPMTQHIECAALLAL